MEENIIEIDVEDPLSAIEKEAWKEISRYSSRKNLSESDFTFTAALWCYDTFCKVYSGLIEGPIGQLLGLV